MSRVGRGGGEQKFSKLCLSGTGMRFILFYGYTCSAILSSGYFFPDPREGVNLEEAACVRRGCHRRLSILRPFKEPCRLEPNQGTHSARTCSANARREETGAWFAGACRGRKRQLNHRACHGRLKALTARERAHAVSCAHACARRTAQWAGERGKGVPDRTS